MTGSLFLGTSGFAYKEWKGIFYPEGTKDADMLRYYSTRFSSVEINYTFRRAPSESTLRAWLERTPEGFRFALKAHQRITHTLRLLGAGEPVERFLGAVKLLGGRLGPILFQCPPSLRFDRTRIEEFLASLPSELAYAMEFRHTSWEEAMPLLRERGVAWCIAETDEAPGRPSWLAEQPFGYLRLRKEHYADDELRAWAGRIDEAMRDGRDVYCFLKHEDKATGPRYAERLTELVERR